MRFKDFYYLTEMPMIHNSDKSISNRDPQYNSDKELNNTYNEYKNDHKKIIDTTINGYHYEGYIDEINKDFRLFVMTESIIIGTMFGEFIGISNYKIPQILTVYVYKNYQNKGIGKTMYELIFDYFKILMSDRTLTNNGGSYDIWVKKLIPNNHFYVYDISNKTLSNEIVDKSSIDDYMNNKTYTFVVSKDTLKI